MCNFEEHFRLDWITNFFKKSTPSRSRWGRNLKSGTFLIFQNLYYFSILIQRPNLCAYACLLRGGGRQMCTPLIHLINPIITWFFDLVTLITGSLEPVFSNPLLVLSVPLLVLSFPAPLVLPNNSLHFKGIYRYNLVEITNSSRKKIAKK